MSQTEYPPPLDQLLQLGEAVARQKEWPDYLAYGIGPEHIPELIRMLSDESLNEAMGDTPEVWAPLHAWRTLAQLGAVEAAEPLLSLLPRIDESGDDWVGEEVPEVFGLLGAKTIPAVAGYLADDEHGLWARIAAARSLGQIGKCHPDARDACVAALLQALERFASHDPTLNSFIISDLLDLRAQEALPVIREAFRSQKVDPTIHGDLQDIEIELGTRTQRSLAPRYPNPIEKLLSETDHQTPKPEWLRTGRNDACPCGSGLKFKKCCLGRVQELQ
jgi:hypothetical protein